MSVEETYEERQARLDTEARDWMAADPDMDYREAYELVLRADDRRKRDARPSHERRPFDWRYDPKYAGRRRGSF